MDYFIGRQSTFSEWVRNVVVLTGSLRGARGSKFHLNRSSDGATAVSNVQRRTRVLKSGGFYVKPVHLPMSINGSTPHPFLAANLSQIRVFLTLAPTSFSAASQSPRQIQIRRIWTDGSGSSDPRRATSPVLPCPSLGAPPQLLPHRAAPLRSASRRCPAASSFPAPSSPSSSSLNSLSLSVCAAGRH